LFVATLRKMQAFSMLVSEITVRDRAGLTNKAAMRALVANTTLFTGIVGLALLVLLLSSVLLPSWEVFLVLLGITVLLAVLLRSFFIRIYAHAQVSIQETLSRELVPHPEHTEFVRKPLPSLLENAELVTVSVEAQSPALGKQIRELELRSRTGATAVAVRRDGETVTSPEPDYEFRLNDQVLLIGSQQQLVEARRLFQP
jgi:CPA2 family monovalent cation:H+ antiporter-2